MERKVGDRIKELRTKMGLTQAELADKVGFTSQTVSNWESGSREPDISALAKLSSLFNVSLDYLLLGKEEETITLDDMDVEKRLSWIIKRDDVENFKKYNYQESAYLFGRTEDYTPNTRHGCNYRFRVTSLNLATWKEIIAEKSYKIFNLALDEMLKKNTQTKCWLAFTVVECMDDFVKAVVENDRDDVLEALGVKFFKIGENNPREKLMLLGSNEYIGDYQAYAIKEETLRYFFEMKEKAPKSYKYITTLSLSDVTLQSRAIDIKSTKTSLVTTFLEGTLLGLAIEYNDFDVVDSIMTEFAKARAHLKELFDNATDGGWTRSYSLVKETYVYQMNNGYYSGAVQIAARVFRYSSGVIEKLIYSGKVELAKKMIAENRDFVQNYSKKLHSENGSLLTAYVISDKEIERMIKLDSPDVSEEEKTLLRCVNESIINISNVKSLRDVKLVKEILDKYYLNYYEFAYDSVSKNDVKALFKLLIDNEFNSLAERLLQCPEHNELFLKECWNMFNMNERYEEYNNHKAFIDRQNKVDLKQDPTLRNVNVDSEAAKLGGNKVIAIIKAQKEAILEAVKSAIAAEKKAKEEAAERAKIVKGLTREYFEGLLQKEEDELFIIKLCSYFDAILRFDYHFDGEDFSARMNQYFAMLENMLPQSRQKDDGWGYMVLDDEYENNEVVPAREEFNHKRNLFNRLRMQRNNIAHSETKKVDELSLGELEECLNYIMPKKGE